MTTEIMLRDPLLFRQACYIGGAWVGAFGGEEINVDDPVTGEVIGRVPKMGAVQTRQAIDAAVRAFPPGAGALRRNAASCSGAGSI